MVSYKIACITGFAEYSVFINFEKNRIFYWISRSDICNPYKMHSCITAFSGVCSFRLRIFGINVNMLR